MDTAIAIELITAFFNEGGSELKNTVKSTLKSGYDNVKTKAARTKEVQDIARDFNAREDSTELQQIDGYGLIEYAADIAERANSLHLALTKEDYEKALLELRSCVYKGANCNDAKNGLLEAFIQSVIEVTDKELERASDAATKFSVAKARKDIEETLREYERTYSQTINGASKDIKESIEKITVQNTDKDRTQCLIDSFYKKAIAKLIDPNTEGGELFGYEPLNDVYITPFIMINGKKVSVMDHIENYFSVSSNKKVMIIFGEPGQGKTSLCWKAAYEFKVNGWQKNRFKNVFRFSLNAANFDLDNKLPLYNYHELETYLTIKGRTLDPVDCKDSLIFLDGFDELYDTLVSKPLQNFSMDYFLRHVLFCSIHEFTGCCFVITSRKMCIEPELVEGKLKDEYTIAGVNAYGICKMDAYEQDTWIGFYGESLRRKAENDEISMTVVKEYEDYIRKLKLLRGNESFKGLLEIPILFRMIIHCRFLPEDKDYNKTSVYDLLFHETIMRHGGDETLVRIAMEKLAYSIFMENDDSADLDDVSRQITVIEGRESSVSNILMSKGLLLSWLHSYYTMYSEGKKRILFLHRSFYQYFLACYIYRSIATLDDQNLDEASLTYLGRRRISQEVYEYLQHLRDKNDNNSLNDKGNLIINILLNTDAVLPNYTLLKEKYNVATIDQAGNVFCNSISALSVLNILPKEALNTTINVTEFHRTRSPLINCLKRYASHGVIIRNASVNGAANSSPSFINAVLIGVDFSNADFKGSSFNGAVLEEVNFHMTDLRGASFLRNTIRKIDFSNADLRGASIENVVFNDSNFYGADFRGATFTNVSFERNIILTNVDFSGASFTNVTFKSCQDIDSINFRGTELTDVEFPCLVECLLHN